MLVKRHRGTEVERVAFATADERSLQNWQNSLWRILYRGFMPYCIALGAETITISVTKLVKKVWLTLGQYAIDLSEW